MAILRDDEPDTAVIARGSNHADVEMCGPESLPLSRDGLYVRTSRQAISARKAKVVGS
jgi:hypothetical protein